MNIIVGLGNPGLQYRFTRHNIGFRCIDLMARTWSIATRDRRAKAILNQGQRLGHDLVLAKPRTFMNNSGEAVDYLLTRFGASVDDLLVIYDDMELPLGRLRIRRSGSDGGHKGIRSIINALRTEDFPRIRIGIGFPPDGQDSVDYVLGCFSKEESLVVNQSVVSVVQAVECVLEENIEVAMNRFN